MPRNVCVSRGGLVALTFRGICHTGASEKSLRAGRLCSIIGHGEASPMDWKLRAQSELFVESSKVTKI